MYLTNKKIPIVLFILAIILLNSGNRLEAQKSILLSGKEQNINQVFLPGYINFRIPLSLFLPLDLKSAASALQGNKREIAAKAFARGIIVHPKDLAAYVGYLQAVPEQWDTLFQVYQKDAIRKPSPENQFKLGLVAFYLASGRIATGKTSEPIEKMHDLSRKNLESAFLVTHDPIAGFVLAGPGSSVSVYEKMLKRNGGIAAYNAYKKAENTEWMASQPPTPSLSANNLLILSYIVNGLLSGHSGLSGDVVIETGNGQSHVIYKSHGYTPEQVKAQAFLSTWESNLKAASLKK